MEAPSVEEEELFYAERIVFEDEPAEEQATEEEPVQEEAPEEEPVQEEQPEEEPMQEEEPEEEQLEEEPMQEEQPEEEPEEEQLEEEPQEEPVEEEPVEEQPVEEESFSGECDLEGNIYNFQSSCVYPLACLSRHEDNFQVIPETGFCGKVCFGDINCPGDTLCVMNGVTPGVGFCER